MINKKQFTADACDLYFKYKHKHQTDDWEQEYFNAMEAKYTTAEGQCIIHLYYHDDDTIPEVAQYMIEDLTGKTLIMATSFDDYDSDTTVVAMIAKQGVNNDNK